MAANSRNVPSQFTKARFIKALNFDFGKISELALQDAAVQGAELTKHISLLTSKYTQLITVTLPLAFVIDLL